MSTTVSLYRYDLSQGMARSMGPMLIGRPIEGIWHTSIVVFGKEYYFDGGVGIVADPNPGRTRFGQPYRTEVLGNTRKRQEEFFAWTQQQRRSGFGPYDYHLLNNNCNSFSDAASMYLLGQHIPQDIIDMIPTLLSSPMGQMLRPMLEQATSGGGAGMGSAPLSQPPPPSAETCRGLLRPRAAVTESEEEDLMVAQAMLESNETIADGPRSPPEAFERAIGGLTLLQTVMANICEHPTEVKYRALSVESKAYTTKLKPLEPYGVTEVLRIAGFVRRPHSSGAGGEQWYLSDEAGSAALLERVGEMLAVTISSIEGAAADAAKARAAAAAGKLAASPTSTAAASTMVDGGARQAAGSEAAAAGSTPTVIGAAKGPVAPQDAVLRYCYPPFPSDWTPLAVGWESGTPLFSIHCLAGSEKRSQKGKGATATEGPYCFGKCHLSPDMGHVAAYYCSSDGREVATTGGYEVLCVRRGAESQLSWVPTRLLSAAAASLGDTQGGVDGVVFTGYGRFGVARAEHGSGVHPGVMEPSGRCVVPYGGRALVVTEKAEVLCETARCPPALLAALRGLQEGERLLAVLRAAGGQPIGSFSELLHRWHPPAFYMPPEPLQEVTCVDAMAFDWEQSRSAAATAGDSSAGGTGASLPASPLARTLVTAPGKERPAMYGGPPCRLLVCHDFGGGYTAGEQRLFVAAAGGKDGAKSAKAQARLPVVEGAYTVGYWDRTDCFVYFSRQRISVPPREWINDGHRRGSPVLGTIITESADGLADLKALLTDAKHMAAVIERLVQVCDVYGFDGYLLNIENDLPANLAKRLVVFCTQLRKALNRPAARTHARLVVWYDAVTIDGALEYQNALTPRNKPFFEACDGVFTNYFWNPVHIAMSKANAGSRGSDVFVGIDVFGRGVFGGGGYSSWVAAEEASRGQLSVALFAPGWTMESESKGTRDGFAVAEGRLWARMQAKFAYHTRVVDFHHHEDEKSAVSTTRTMQPAAWTAFRSGIGYHFYVNGRRVSGAAVGVAGAQKGTCVTSGWCELSAAHATPPLLLEAALADGAAEKFSPFAAAAAAAPPAPFAPQSFTVPASLLVGSMYGGSSRCAWRYDKAWFGDRCLSCVLPSQEAAEVLRWYVRDALPGVTAPTTAEASMASLRLHIEVVFDQSTVVACVTSGDDGKQRAPVSEYRALRLGLYSPLRGPFYVQLWERLAATPDKTTPVPGLETVQVRCVCEDDTAVCAADHTSTATTGAAAAAPATGWRRVHYELHNLSPETIHLTSISVANGNPSQVVQYCVGGLAVYQTAPQHSASATAAAKGMEAEEARRDARAGRVGSVLRAAGACPWPAHTTHETGKGEEHVLALADAEAVLAEVQAMYGADTTMVLFASLANTDSESTAECAGTGLDEESASHTMYLGQYKTDPKVNVVYEGSLIVAITLPESLRVSRVFYYVVPNGY